MSRPLRGFYAITPDRLAREPAELAAAVAAALSGGAKLIQYRDKGLGARSDAVARELLALCRISRARFIVNDDVDLCERIGADGVHLGAQDMPLREARRRIGDAAIIGISCGNRLERALAAQDDGASYVALGRFFPSRTKPEAVQAHPELLTRARAVLKTPICVIGGMTPDNAAPLVAAGADMVAAVDGVFGSVDVAGAARAYARLFVE